MTLRPDELDVHEPTVTTKEGAPAPAGDERRPVTDVMAASPRGASPRPGVTRSPGAPLGLILGGFMALLVSAWAGLVPFLGPTFGYSADGSSAWTWNRVHVLAAVAPAVVGVLSSWWILARVRRPLNGRFTTGLAGFGFLLVASGAWLTVAPVVWPVVAGGYFLPATAGETLAYWLGYASGPGVLLVAFGAMVMGRSVAPSRATSAEGG